MAADQPKELQFSYEVQTQMLTLQATCCALEFLGAAG